MTLKRLKMILRKLYLKKRFDLYVYTRTILYELVQHISIGIQYLLIKKRIILVRQMTNHKTIKKYIYIHSSLHCQDYNILLFLAFFLLFFYKSMLPISC